jgi:hypothetical protein
MRCSDSIARVYSRDSGELLMELAGHAGSVSCVVAYEWSQPQQGLHVCISGILTANDFLCASVLPIYLPTQLRVIASHCLKFQNQISLSIK